MVTPCQTAPLLRYIRKNSDHQSCIVNRRSGLGSGKKKQRATLGSGKELIMQRVRAHSDSSRASPVLFQLRAGACCGKVTNLLRPCSPHKGKVQTWWVCAGLNLESTGSHHRGRSGKAQGLHEQHCCKKGSFARGAKCDASNSFQEHMVIAATAVTFQQPETVRD